MKRAYRTKSYWKKFDGELNVKFPVGSTQRWYRHKVLVEGKVMSPANHGRLEVQNSISGKYYWVNAEMFVLADLPEPPKDRIHPSVTRILKPILEEEYRGGPNGHEGRVAAAEKKRMMPLSFDELKSHTTLTAVSKALNRIHQDSDSFRNPKLLDLVRAAQTCLETVLAELESYDRLPDEA